VACLYLLCPILNNISAVSCQLSHFGPFGFLRREKSPGKPPSLDAIDVVRNRDCFAEVLLSPELGPAIKASFEDLTSSALGEGRVLCLDDPVSRSM